MIPSEKKSKPALLCPSFSLPPSNTPPTALPFRFNLAISLTFQRRRRTEIGEIRGEDPSALPRPYFSSPPSKASRLLSEKNNFVNTDQFHHSTNQPCPCLHHFVTIVCSLGSPPRLQRRSEKFISPFPIKFDDRSAEC